ncbi:MAG: SDR family NAD(P)-dependent oxidoreductase [Balneolaceae bacterium]|nr:SDR family NAD(P)-dependent oxidoreductase [Balneolaceae bacterium]
MNRRIEGKRALVTGATAGIGRATARLLAEAGCEVAVTGRREERLQELREEIEEVCDVPVHTGAFDLRDRGDCRDFLEGLPGPVDILVNNAGLAYGTDAVYEADFDDWDAMIDTNVKALLTMTRLVSPSMREREEGHIINIGSIAGHESYAGGAVYCATKHAVKAITEATKKDLHGTPVRVSMVSPGLVETEFSMVRYRGDRERAESVYENMQPLVAEDIAEIVVFVAGRPPHVNIMDTVVFPVAQSSSSMVWREGEDARA